MNARTIWFWVTTGLLSFVMISGGFSELTNLYGDTRQTTTLLGYPEYFLYIIGTWKIAAGIVILLPRLPLVKEWAYAGMFFNMTGAFASSIFMRNFEGGGYHPIAEASIALLVVASWALRPASGRLVDVFARRPRFSEKPVAAAA